MKFRTPTKKEIENYQKEFRKRYLLYSTIATIFSLASFVIINLIGLSVLFWGCAINSHINFRYWDRRSRDRK